MLRDMTNEMLNANAKRYRESDIVTVVEHDPQTGKPLDGGTVHIGTVVYAGQDEVDVSFSKDLDAPLYRGDTFWSESGWRAHSDGSDWRVFPHGTETPARVTATED